MRRAPRLAALAAVTLAATLALPVAQAAQPPPLRLGTEGAYAPFNYVDSQGQVRGFDVDMGNALCAQMRRRCVWVTQEWQGMIPALRGHKFDVIIASLAITDKRRKQVAFTQPYYQTVGMFVARRGSGLSQTPAALRRRTIGAVRATPNALYVQRVYGATAKVRVYQSSDDMFLDFLIGRLDLVFGDAVEMRPWIARNGGEARYERVGAYVKDRALGEGIGIAVRQDDSQLLTQLNRALAQIKADGRYRRINERYFDFRLD